MIFLEQADSVGISVLIGSSDAEMQQVSVLSAVHFLKESSKDHLLEDQDFWSCIKSFKSMLPFGLNIIGLALYSEESSHELESNFLRGISADFLVRIQALKIDYYQLTKDGFKSIKADSLEIPARNLLTFIYTLEFETTNRVLENQAEMKKAIFRGLDFNWDHASFNKKSDTKLSDFLILKNPLDRIIEVQIPCEEKDLSSATKEGNVFLAFDLHINCYLVLSQLQKQLNEILDFVYLGLKHDLHIKLQRSTYDEVTKRLVAPMKVPIRLDSLILNGYLSLEATSIYEYEMCVKLVDHAKIISKLSKDKEARILLTDLYDYFNRFDEKAVAKEISDLIKTMI
jgi:hypothetical protein